ncbi:prevent-host-death protein [Kitasatospora purpeofusca]|uniref:type II toxin-antitoxin system Phd/YefM family antitoxin n=1 Tax=Kitasatospora purpeofusca TaxID=67352 RepID=UPI0030F00B48
MEATVQELNQRTAELIAAVERGGTVTVIRDGRHVATIRPPDFAGLCCERVGAVVPTEILDSMEEAADELAAREAELHRDDPTVGMAELLVDLFDAAPPESAVHRRL